MGRLPYYNLRELSKNHSVVLLDTSSFIGTEKEFGSNIEERIEAGIRTIESLVIKILKEDNIYFTEKIFEEIHSHKFAPNRLEERGREYEHLQKIYLKLKEEFLETIKSNERIFYTSKKEENLVRRMSKEYFVSKLRYSLSQEDYNLVLVALAHSQYEGRSAIVTNDGGIVEFSKYLLTQRKRDGRVDVYNHESLGIFVPAIDFFKQNKKPKTIRVQPEMFFRNKNAY